MPNMFGGSSTDEDYAPHMHLQGHFIHNTGKKITVGDTHYYAGMSSDEKLVAERWTDANPTPELVPQDEIPKEVRELLSPTAFADGKAERSAIAQLVSGS